MTRLDSIASLVDERVVADIGSDHGFLIKILLSKNKIDYAYACDISEKCLDKSRKNLSDFIGKVSFLCGDGLEPLNNLLDGNLAQNNQNTLPKEIVIAGMGGKEIIKILSHNTSKIFDKFILSPQRNIVEVRKYLVQNNFRITIDKVVKEGKMFYNLIKAVRTKDSAMQSLSEKELYFGLSNLKEMNNDFIMFAKYQIDSWGDVLSKKEIKSIRYKYNLLKEILKDSNLA